MDMARLENMRWKVTWGSRKGQTKINENPRNLTPLNCLATPMCIGPNYNAMMRFNSFESPTIIVNHPTSSAWGSSICHSKVEKSFPPVFLTGCNNGGRSTHRVIQCVGNRTERERSWPRRQPMADDRSFWWMTCVTWLEFVSSSFVWLQSANRLAEIFNEMKREICTRQHTRVCRIQPTGRLYIYIHTHIYMYTHTNGRYLV